MNAQNTPSSLQHAVFKFVTNLSASAEQGASFNTFSFPGTMTDKYWVATTTSSIKKGAVINLSLPEWVNKCFINLSDQHPDSFAELVASFNAESETNDALKVGYAEKLDIPVLNARGWHGIAMVKPEMLFPNFPSLANIVGEEYEFVLVVLITADEYGIWRKDGFEALQNVLASNGRDLVAFNQETAPHSAPTQTSMQTHTTQFDQLDSMATQNTQGATRVKSSAPITKPIKVSAAIAPPLQPLGISRPIPPQSAPMGFNSAPLGAYPHTLKQSSIEPLFPTQTNNPLTNVPSDPLRIKMDIEPCQEFLDGNLRELHVGTVNKVKQTNPVQAASVAAASEASELNTKPMARTFSEPKPAAAASQIAQQKLAPNALPKKQAAPKKIIQPTPATIQPSAQNNAQSRSIKPNTRPVPTKQKVIANPQQSKASSPQEKVYKGANRTKQPIATTLNLDYEEFAFSPDEFALDELNYVQEQKIKEPMLKEGWQVMSVTALGGVLVTSGLIMTILTMDLQASIPAAVPITFALGGIGALISGFKDAIAIGTKRSVSDEDNNNLTD